MEKLETIAQYAARDLGPSMLGEADCREWFLQEMHAARYVCPGCGATIESNRQCFRYNSGERVVCGVCGKFFTCKTGTILEGVSLSFSQVFILLALRGLKVSTPSIAAHIGVSPSTVSRFFARFQGEQ